MITWNPDRTSPALVPPTADHALLRMRTQCADAVNALEAALRTAKECGHEVAVYELSMAAPWVRAALDAANVAAGEAYQRLHGCESQNRRCLLSCKSERAAIVGWLRSQTSMTLGGSATDAMPHIANELESQADATPMPHDELRSHFARYEAALREIEQNAGSWKPDGYSMTMNYGDIIRAAREALGIDPA